MTYSPWVVLVFFVSSLSCDDIVMLISNESTVVGRKLFTVLDNKPYAAFWKIPYAEPPLRELRFKPPKPYKLWFDDITYDFSKPYNETCASGFTEDCLYLSIHKPITENETTIFPVLVWIHEQSHIHGPDFLIDQEIIVVTVSYRTSLIGFLNTGDEFAQGNMGPKDIIMALKWIRDNITLFNGDPSTVTVVGSESAANIVGGFLVSLAAEDLFTRIIIQGGSALSPADYRNYNFEVLNKLYWRLNGPFVKLNRLRLYQLLHDATTKDLFSVSEGLFDSTEVRDNQRLINSFGPTVEDSNKHAFINKHPLEVYKRKMANNNIDVMIGYTSLESLHKLKGFVENRKLLKYLNYNFQYLLPFEGLPDEYDSERYTEIRGKIMDFYFINGTIGERSLKRYAKYVSDQVIYPLLRQARLHAEGSCNNVYLYRFTFKGALNIGWDGSIRNLNYTGATAGDEICYLFRCKSVNDVYRSAEASAERQFIKKIVRLWANFAKCGNPTPDTKNSGEDNIKWKPLVPYQKLRGINFGKKIKMVNVPEEKRVKFWDQLKKNFFPDKLWLKDEL